MYCCLTLSKAPCGVTVHSLCEYLSHGYGNTDTGKLGRRRVRRKDHFCTTTGIAATVEVTDPVLVILTLENSIRKYQTHPLKVDGMGVKTVIFGEWTALYREPAEGTKYRTGRHRCRHNSGNTNRQAGNTTMDAEKELCWGLGACTPLWIGRSDSSFWGTSQRYSRGPNFQGDTRKCRT